MNVAIELNIAFDSDFDEDFNRLLFDAFGGSVICHF